MKIQLEDISINDYAKMLRAGVDFEKIQAIEAELNRVLGGIGSGFDISLFMLQKDLLIFQCKAARAWLDHDNEKLEIWNKKITELQEQIGKKTVKKERGNPYQSFLSWILSVEKFLSFAIDKNNDLLYFAEATKQMINYYENQKKQIEEQNAKRK